MNPLAADLAEALRSDQLFLVYQPKIALASGQWSGVEALLRWRHPTRGLVPPNHFIPVAEASGMMRPLTDRVIEMALDRWTEWHRSGLDIKIAINLSAKDIEPDFPDRFDRTRLAKGVPAEMIVFELTETATHDVTDLLDIATRLRVKGTRLSIDDFGTGYSSVVQLHRLPFSELKIDRCFVSEIESSAEARAIVRAIVNLAHALDLTVVAEGTESEREVGYLAGLGCDEAQGYYFSRPLDPAALAALWRSRAPVVPAMISGIDPLADLTLPLPI